MPVLEDSQLLIRSVYLSLDPAMRGWLIDRPSYVPSTFLKKNSGVVIPISTLGISTGLLSSIFTFSWLRPYQMPYHIDIIT